MMYENIPYQSFCWVIGTTSFRTAKLNLKIEEQLYLLSKFRESIENDKNAWVWNPQTQAQYYDYMHFHNFVTGDAPNKDKDAREKTSGLVDIGLLTKERKLTEVGEVLLAYAKDTTRESTNVLGLREDSFIYLRQILKTSLDIDGRKIRPLFVVIRCLVELKYLTVQEFTYLIPLITNQESFEIIIEAIKDLREQKVSISDVIYRVLISKNNYQRALQLWLDNEVSMDLITTIGMNRKSRDYDKPYVHVYNALYENFFLGNTNYVKLLETLNDLKNIKGEWRNLLFSSTAKSLISTNDPSCLSETNPFLNCADETEFKTQFFKYLHVLKAYKTLRDYYDLNRRYFNLTSIFVFEKTEIKLDILPSYYFRIVIKELFAEAFTEHDKLEQDIPLNEISPALDIDIRRVYELMEIELGEKITSVEQSYLYLRNQRNEQFNRLIDERFSDEVLIKLLRYFEERNDKKIEELVTDEANIPTIFEYITGIIWYKLSERQGNLINFLKLSLDTNLLPISHALGGVADIIYEYDETPHYPEHNLLIEVTLSDASNQRRMEMEPVSRHLGEHLIKNKNEKDYCVFVSTYLDQNVIYDFTYRRIIPFTKNGELIIGMKIIPLNTDHLRVLLQNKVKYSTIYKFFARHYDYELTPEWHQQLITELYQWEDF